MVDYVSVKRGLQFTRAFLQQEGIDERTGEVIYAEGDSMLPTLPSGSVVLLNTADKTLLHGKVYLIVDRYEGAKIKRLIRDGDGWLIRSDNENRRAHPDESFDEESHFLGAARCGLAVASKGVFMKSRKFVWLLTGVCTVLSAGCATQATLTVYSQPEGAYITEASSGRSLGIAPLVLRYDQKELAKRKGINGCFYVNGLMARWVSGVTVSIDNPNMCGRTNGAYSTTFSRPAAAPGIATDLQFALQLQSVRVQQRQAQAAEDAASAELFRAFNPPQSRSVNCLSTKVGNLVQTSCY